MKRTRDQRDDDRAQILAALEETGHGTALRFDALIEAVTGEPHHRLGHTDRLTMARDLHALARQGLVVETGEPWAYWTSWALSTPEDEDERTDREEVQRMMNAWVLDTVEHP